VGYARKFFKKESHHAAEDVVQEAFLSLSQQPNLPENVIGWLYAAVRSKSLDVIRGDKRRKKRNEGHAQPLIQPESGSPFDFEKITLELEKLSLEQREIIMMHFWGGLTFAEIATAIGKPKTTVFRRYEEAIKMLVPVADLLCPGK
jgi:RNA polymerase sigma-70 factor (ECF subfamily)